MRVAVMLHLFLEFAWDAVVRFGKEELVESQKLSADVKPYCVAEV